MTMLEQMIDSYRPMKEDLGHVLYSCPAFHRMNIQTQQMAHFRPVIQNDIRFDMSPRIDPISRYDPPDYSPGLQNSKPFQYGYDLPATGSQIHFHGDDRDHITHGHFLDRDRNVLGNLNGYDSSMADLNARRLGFNRFDRGGYGNNY